VDLVVKVNLGLMEDSMLAGAVVV
jgi:hypothetical protein